MAVPKKAQPYLRFGNFTEEELGPDKVRGWQPVWCAKHHFETLARGLLRCPYGCPPGPQIITLQSEAFELFPGGARGGAKSEVGRGWLLKGNLGEPNHETIPEHIIIGHGPEAYCPICVNQSYIFHPRYRALIVRRNAKDLADWLGRAKSLYGMMGADVTETPARIKWPSGAEFWLGHLDDANAYTAYQGQEFQRIIFEELTLIEKEMLYLQVIGSCRSTFLCRKGCKKGTCKCGVLKRQVLATANPGEIGHAWVKKRFVSVGQPNQVYTDPLTKQTRIYIPALVTDNPYLMQDDGYLAWLEGLPEPKRSAWRFGDWDALGGSYFLDFRPRGPIGNEPPEANHVIPRGSRNLLPWWTRWMGGDWGFGHNSAFYCACQDPNGQIIIYRELIFKETGSVEIGDALGRALLPDFEQMIQAGVEPRMNFWLSPDAFGKRDAYGTIAERIRQGMERVLGKDSIHLPELYGQPDTSEWGAETFQQIRNQQKIGVSIKLAQTDRVAGWDKMRELMRWKQIARPAANTYSHEYAVKLLHESDERYRMYVSAYEARKPEVLPKLLIVAGDCPHLIAAIPTAQYKEGTEDVLKTDTPEDDALDATRYLLISQLSAAVVEPQQSFVHRKLSELRERQSSVDYNDLVWAAMKAEADYGNLHQPIKPFSVPIDSSRAAKRRRLHYSVQ